MNLTAPIRTQRLMLIPCPLHRLVEKAEAETDLHLKKAYLEMAEGIRQHPDEWLWRTDWDIIRSEDGRVIGGLGFKNVPDVSGRVEVGYGLDTAFRGLGFMGEALLALCDWAFSHQEVLSVIAEVEPGNAASVHVLQRAGFHSLSTTDNAWFVKERAIV